MNNAKWNKFTCPTCNKGTDLRNFVADKSKCIGSSAAKALNPKYVTAAATAIASVFTKHNKLEELRQKRERELARQRRKCTRNAIIAGLGGAAAGVAAGYFAARTLQLSERYAERDTDIYKKNPTLSDYAPTPAPNLATKEYLPFDDNSQISTDGTTILTRN